MRSEFIGKETGGQDPVGIKEQSLRFRSQGSKKIKARLKGGLSDWRPIKNKESGFPGELRLRDVKGGEHQFIVDFLSESRIKKLSGADFYRFYNQLESNVEQRTKDLTDTLHELEVSKNKLERLLSFQKAILDNAGAMIIATDVNGVIKLFNPEAALNIGYTEAEVVNKLNLTALHSKEEIERKRLKLRDEFGISLSEDFSVLVEKSLRNIHEEEQYTYIRKARSTFPVSLTITAIKSMEGEVTGFMGIAIDISARIKAEDDLRKSLEKEKELNELKSRFVSMASHEFRTPLSTILSSAYLIDCYKSVEDQPNRSKHLQRIVGSVNMLTDILNEFLSVGKIEEGKIHVRITRFNLSEFLGTLAEEIQSTLKKSQKINYRHEGSLEVELDVYLLKYIIFNLVSNASKFSPEKSVIEINSFVDKGLVRISVRDRGIGISREDQKHLMERFFRGENAVNIQGTGLGLHIVSKYAELMNGRLECKSVLDKGSVFTITFLRRDES